MLATQAYTTQVLWNFTWMNAAEFVHRMVGQVIGRVFGNAPDQGNVLKTWNTAAREE